MDYEHFVILYFMHPEENPRMKSSEKKIMLQHTSVVLDIIIIQKKRSTIKWHAEKQLMSILQIDTVRCKFYVDDF